jgi:uncharacterized membrane protein
MEWIKVISLVIEYLAVAIIAGMVGYSTLKYFILLITKRNAANANYREYKHTLGRALLLGLEILVAADVIRTVALEPSFGNIAALGLLVLVRTFLSWSLVVEIEGRWPWQKPRPVVNTEDILND